MNWKMRGQKEKYRQFAFNIILCIYVVHGNWSRWTPWPNCNKPCNNGTRTRRRACDNPRPAFGGEKCKGLTFESERCNQEKCPGKRFLTLFFFLACQVLHPESQRSNEVTRKRWRSLVILDQNPFSAKVSLERVILYLFQQHVRFSCIVFGAQCFC